MKPPVINCKFKFVKKDTNRDTGTYELITLLEDVGFLELCETSGVIDEMLSENADISKLKQLTSTLTCELNFNAGQYPLASLQAKITEYKKNECDMLFSIKEIEHIPLAGFPVTIYITRSFDN